MPKKYPAEVRDRAVRMVVDWLSEYPSIYAACKALAPKLAVGPESLRQWVLQDQVDTGVKDGPTTTERDECQIASVGSDVLARWCGEVVVVLLDRTFRVPGTPFPRRWYCFVFFRVSLRGFTAQQVL